MALDTSGNWEAGDDLRIIEALMLPFGTYVLDCTQNCMAQLEDMSPEAVLRVRALLDEYEAADQAESGQNLGDTEGKVLVKADVLEWEVVNGGISGSSQEKGKGSRRDCSLFQLLFLAWAAFFLVALVAVATEPPL